MGSYLLVKKQFQSIRILNATLLQLLQTMLTFSLFALKTEISNLIKSLLFDPRFEQNSPVKRENKKFKGCTTFTIRIRNVLKLQLLNARTFCRQKFEI